MESKVVNLLIELYDYPCGEDFYYIQNNEVKEFSDEIYEKLSEISIVILTGGLFFGVESEIKKRKEEAISEISDCLKSFGYSIEKIFVMNDGTLVNSYTVENKQ